MHASCARHFVGLLLASLMFAACTQTAGPVVAPPRPSVEQQRLALQTTVTVAVAALLRSHPAYAQPLMQATQAARAALSQGNATPAMQLVVDQLTRVLQRPEDAALAALVLLPLQGQMDLWLKEHAEVPAIAGDVLTWVETVAALFVRV